MAALAPWPAARITLDGSPTPFTEPSLSQQLATFVAGLEFEQLPDALVERAKALLLHNLANALVGARYPVSRRVLAFVRREEAADETGCTLLVVGGRVTKMAAAYANSLLMHVTGQSDSYDVFTHPGLTVVPGALALGEAEQSTGRDVLTSIVAGYEVLTRVASPALSRTQANGFRSGAVYGGVGAAVAAAKAMRLDAQGVVDAIANWVSVAAGNLEGARSGGHETVLHEPTAARNGVLAALQARDGFRGGSTVLEGSAGFYRAYAGIGRTDQPDGPDLNAVTSGLGQRWAALGVIQKAYSTSGYNQPVIELSYALARDHQLLVTEIERVIVELNRFEVLYPSPEFTHLVPTPRRKSSHYFSAWGLAAGRYPRLGRPIGHMVGLDEDDQPDPPDVLDLMHKVTVVPSEDRPLMSARVTVTTTRGTFSAVATGSEFAWSFDRTTERAGELVAGMAVSAERFEALAAAVARLDEADSIVPLLALTLAESTP